MSLKNLGQEKDIKVSDKVKGILLREETLEAMLALSDEQRGRLILALFADSGMCEEPELDPVTRMAFICIAPGVRRAQEEASRRYAVSVENGKKGGRPRKQPVQDVIEETDGITEKPTGFEETCRLEKNQNQIKPNETKPSEINYDTLSECMSGQSPDVPSLPEEYEPEKQEEPEESTAKRPPCPAKEIVELYHEILPEHPRVEILNETRRRSINARWSDIGTRLKEKGREDSRTARLAYMRQIFLKASQSDFLCGRTTCRDGKTYMVTFDKLMSPSGFIGVIEGKYDNRG